MNKILFVALTVCLAGLASAIDKSRAIDTSEDLRPEESQKRIYAIIQEHEDRKFGDSTIHERHRDHGGHEYEAGEVPLKLASQKQYGYLPYHADEKTPVYYDAPKSKDKVYRENVAAYAAKSAPMHLANSPHHTLVEPVKHSYYTRGSDPKPYGYSVARPKSHRHIYAVVDPKPAPQHYALVEPKSHIQHYAVEKPKSHIQHYPVSQTKNHVQHYEPKGQYVYFDDQKPHHERPLILEQPKANPAYILEPEPEYVVPKHKVIVKPAVVSHYPVKEYSHHANDHHSLDKGYQSSGHGYHGDSSVHGESGHKAHKSHEIADHKEHSTKAGHHDEHDHNHNKAHYERDRGYHYEKAYAYDRVRAHHDIGSDKGSHSDYHDHHGQEGHKESGDHGSKSYMYFKKNDQHHGHHDKANTLYKGGHKAGQGYHDYELKYLPPHPY
ncbi:hypothetical protein JTE90_022144 [Oedothorax gibbosus]|uniref:Uncharacterized protein n=1 Tax=Oedothorax gibbosus TaxID=931172 RepID=A0AAV6VSR2_9ARAC|nr:hypothetical protein JTE90_022144 [Oedothorax gibbosus]